MEIVQGDEEREQKTLEKNCSIHNQEKIISSKLKSARYCFKKSFILPLITRKKMKDFFFQLGSKLREKKKTGIGSLESFNGNKKSTYRNDSIIKSQLLILYHDLSKRQGRVLTFEPFKVILINFQLLNFIYHMKENEKIKSISTF